MSALPGLPQFTIPDDAEQDWGERPDIASTQAQSLTVADGEVWLPQVIVCGFQLSAAAGNRLVTISYRNPNLDNPNFWVFSLGPFTAGMQGRLSWALGQDTSTANAAAPGFSGGFQGPLPWASIFQGCSVHLFLDGDVDVADQLNGNLNWAYTRWLLGNGQAGGGDAGQLGPFMFVPGPGGV